MRIGATIMLNIGLNTARDGLAELAGVCRLLPGTLIADGYEPARAQVTEAAREFITSVADVVTRSGAQGQEPPARGEAQSWVTGVPRQQLPGGTRSHACRSPASSSQKNKSISPNEFGILDSLP